MPYAGFEPTVSASKRSKPTPQTAAVVIYFRISIINDNSTLLLIFENYTSTVVLVLESSGRTVLEPRQGKFLDHPDL
jgi:hypothetical protein